MTNKEEKNHGENIELSDLNHRMLIEKAREDLRALEKTWMQIFFKFLLFKRRIN